MGQASLTPALFLFMRKPLCLAWAFLPLSGLFSTTALCQTPAKASAADSTHQIQQAISGAKAGHCKTALPVLRQALRGPAGDLKRQAAFAGVRCAMLDPNPGASNEFLSVLTRDYPGDPEVLYLAVHTYSDLSTRAAQELATRAPNSPQAHELNAEALEMQGKWDEAAREYQAVLQQEPRQPGIHFRVGRLILSRPNPPPDMAEQARKEFLEELQIDPNNAGAEYILGELARQAQQWDEAIRRFTRATQLDPGFGDAFLGLGTSLMSVKKFSEAIAPLETAVRLEPANALSHYSLAVAYTRSGRRQDADREFAIHRQMMQKSQAAGEAAAPPAPSEAAPAAAPPPAPEPAAPPNAPQ